MITVDVLLKQSDEIESIDLDGLTFLEVANAIKWVSDNQEYDIYFDGQVITLEQAAHLSWHPQAVCIYVLVYHAPDEAISKLQDGYTFLANDDELFDWWCDRYNAPEAVRPYLKRDEILAVAANDLYRVGGGWFRFN